MMASTVAGNVSTTPASLSANLSRYPLRLRARAPMIASAYSYRPTLGRHSDWGHLEKSRGPPLGGSAIRRGRVRPPQARARAATGGRWTAYGPRQGRSGGALLDESGGALRGWWRHSARQAQLVSFDGLARGSVVRCWLAEGRDRDGPALSGLDPRFVQQDQRQPIRDRSHIDLPALAASARPRGDKRQR